MSCLRHSKCVTSERAREGCDARTLTRHGSQSHEPSGDSPGFQNDNPAADIEGGRSRTPRRHLLKLLFFVNREAMAGTGPGRQSGETAISARHRVPKGRQADPDKINVVPSGLWGVCCTLTMDLRPWLLHVMPSAFKSVTSERASEGCDLLGFVSHRKSRERASSFDSSSETSSRRSQTTWMTSSSRCSRPVARRTVANRAVFLNRSQTDG